MQQIIAILIISIFTSSNSLSQNFEIDRVTTNLLNSKLKKTNDEVIVDIQFYYGINGADRCCEIDLARDQNKLESILDFLADNKKIAIEIGSHTDCLGIEKFNLSVSKYRLKNLKELLIIISKRENQLQLMDRINFIAYGEQYPIENCECKNCSELENKINKRIETLC